jgi:two-component system phosphate regulon sensor histidine kinase PhoR
MGRGFWTTMLAGGAGVVALLALAFTGRASGGEAVLAALAAAAATILCLNSLRARAAPSVQADRPAMATDDGAASFTALIDALPDPMLVVSAREPDDLTDRRIVFANIAARELLRIQRDPSLLVTAVRDPGVLEAADESLFGAVEAEAVFETGGAQARIFRVLTRPLEQARGGGGLALLVFREETEQRRVEQTRADFLANASHELRTPLASLSGFIETLRGHARDDAGARDRFLGIMQAQTERMARLIDDLMSLSRIELNEHLPPAEQVDLTGAVLDVLDALGPIARERGVRLEPVAPERGQAMVTGDRDQIIQVVQNLVDNALKYTPRDGTVRILLEAGLTADAAAGHGAPLAARLPLLTPDHGQDRYVALRVIDEGPGIAREHLPRLTERFYRVEGQKSGERSGTGLGLAIVKHIMNRHRGGLAVESRPGRGAAFTAYFPQAAAPANAPAPQLESKLS